MGGISPERPVSLNSGKAIVKALKAVGYPVTVIDYNGDLSRWIPDFKASDLVFMALHGGDGESGQVQAFLQLLNVPYTGTGPLGSAVSMDKHMSKSLFVQNGIPTPDWVFLTENSVPELPFDFPVVVKPNDQGSTIGLTVVNLKEELDAAVNKAFEYAESILIERFIAGRELTVTVLDNRALPIVEIKPSHGLYDYECKYTSGMSQYECPASLSEMLTEQVQDYALSVFEILRGRHYSRIDFRLDKENQPWCLEMNTLPGMTATSLVPKAAAAEGTDFETLVDKMVKLALK